MKKKIIFGALTGFVALFMMLSVNLSNASDNSLNITVMAKANASASPDCPTGCLACGSYCHCNGDYYWLHPAGGK